MPGVKCRPNRVRRTHEIDRDEAAGKAGGVSLPKSQFPVIDAAKMATYLNPNIHRY